MRGSERLPVGVDVIDDAHAVDDAAETAEDTPAFIDVLGNDSDPDGDPLTVVEASAPAHGSARLTDAVSVWGAPSLDSAFLRVSNPATVYIFDDDATSARVVVVPVPTEVFEGETSTIIATISQPLSDDVTVLIGVDEADSNHTATADEYTLSANRTLTIPAGQIRSTGEVTLAAANDEYYGPLPFRRVVLDIASVTGIDRNQVYKQNDWHIIEDEAAPRVTLEPAPASIRISLLPETPLGTRIGRLDLGRSMAARKQTKHDF